MEYQNKKIHNIKSQKSAFVNMKPPAMHDKKEEDNRENMESKRRMWDPGEGMGSGSSVRY